MGNLVGILSTVILVSTMATLIFAVFAYMASRKRTTTPKTVRREYPMPPSPAASPVPREFILRMQDVMPKSTPKHAPPAPSLTPPPPPPTPAPEAPPPTSSNGSSPIFRSLADKKRLAASEEPAPPSSTKTDV